MRLPVVWVLKAMTKWVMPPKRMVQPMKRVMAIPEMSGMRMAKKPARSRRMLRAMDQLTALPAMDLRGVGLLMLMRFSPPKDVDISGWECGRMAGER
jgi:hypothetical protein